MVMFYTVYKTTNTVNGKTYVGAHRTNDLNDDYLGSGRLLCRAIEKHGRESFNREFIAVFDNAADMYAMEARVVNEAFVANPDTYNLKQGGSGGFDHVKENGMRGRTHSPEFRAQQSERMKALWRSHPSFTCPEYREKQRQRFLTTPRENGFKGRRHSEESKRLIGAANTGLTGSKNPNFGNCWIHLGDDSKLVQLSELDYWLERGWLKGRRIPKLRKQTLHSEKEKHIAEKRSGVEKTKTSKVSDEDYLKALRSHPTIAAALRSLGLADRGKNYVRAKRLLGLEGVKLEVGQRITRPK